MMTSKIHVWHTGQVYIDQAMAFQEKTWHPMPYTGWFRSSTKKRWMPVSAYLIEHPKGLVLIDTGWHEDMRTNPKKHLGWLTSTMFTGTLPEGQSVAERLQAKGIQNKDIDYVLLTHLHSDHVSGVKHVADAKHIVTNELEWHAAQKDAGYIKSMWESVPINTFQLQEIPYGPYQLGYDVFQDGSLYMVYTPGHSKGLCSALVQTTKGWVLLASDVGYSERSWEQNVLPGVTIDKDAAQKSLDWVREFRKREDCVQVIANHDPSINEQVIE
ncbi:N-acyl homoserine lactonase family protein [Bacillus sp. NPDC077411]|uniref:N-acyl homoserine lactonase family protein n=1 Tax=Bacillus sp. NPDC077411 TaxID=3363947 RepID=UPI0037C9D6B6